ncbi:MAG: RluA family pseudouridine synthase [Campylobacteraceae bacterium]|nr:RluA family pseudouridine synthase [Campylobacteraceae bacterium]
MPYISKDFIVDKPVKAWTFLVHELGFSMREAQRAIDRKQLLQNGEIVKRKSDTVSKIVTLLVYEPRPKGLLPVYENEFFAVFNKPSGVLTHPRSRITDYSLNDEIKYRYGKNANVVHRLDKETSGLIIVSKSKEYENELKKLFSNREVEKKYKALVRGRIDEEMKIDAPILINRDFVAIKTKVCINKNGAHALTEIKPLKYFEEIDATLVHVTPRTGRQHQIRVHLFHVEHSIIGDPLYGVNTKMATMYLDGQMDVKSRIKFTGSERLLLHADELKFEYRGEEYSFKSKIDIESEFITFAAAIKKHIHD